jgi:hypothetical protein
MTEARALKSALELKLIDALQSQPSKLPQLWKTASAT